MKYYILLLNFLLVNSTIRASHVYRVASQEEFVKAAEKAVPGDEIVISNGAYADWSLTVSTHGTASKPIKVRAETSGNVVFSGDINKPVFLFTGSYTEISGLAFTGCNIFKGAGGTGVLIELRSTNFCRITDCSFTKNAVKAQYMPIVVVSGEGENNRVDHCTFTGNIDNQELQVKVGADVAPQYTRIDHNVFSDKDKVSWKGTNGGECVQVGQDPILRGTAITHSIVRDNRFIRCNGEAEVISNKSSGNSYINNYFENCDGELVMRGGHDCLIDSNTVKGGKGGIRVNGSHHTITNNTLSGLSTGIRFMYGMAKGKEEIGFYIAASDCLVKNNRISDTVTGILIGDSKNADWTGKFDTTKYPSRVMQDVAPFNITLVDNTITGAKSSVINRDKE